MNSKDFYKEQLLKLRSKLAYETKNKHAWSFTDVELDTLLKTEPRTLEQLTKLKGFPKTGKRVNSYGKVIVNIFNSKPVKDFKVKMSKDGGELEVDEVMKPLSNFTR